MYNVDVRDAIKEKRLFHYEVAEIIGITECSLSRLLARKELSPERKQKILDAIGYKRNTGKKEAKEDHAKNASSAE